MTVQPHRSSSNLARAARLPGLSGTDADHEIESRDESDRLADAGRRRWLGSGLAAALASVGGTPANAFCGDPFPSWAYFIKFDEAALPVSLGGNRYSVFVRALGDKTREKAAKLRPLVVIPGGPGLPHDYLETIEAVSATERRVLLFDPIGTGSSSPLPKGDKEKQDLSTPAALSAQVAGVVAGAELDGTPHHIFAHGTGVAAALLYASGRDDVASLVLASPLLESPPTTPPAFVAAEKEGPAEAVSSGSTGSTGASPSGGPGLFPWVADTELSKNSLTRNRSKLPLCLSEAYQGSNPRLYSSWQAAPASTLKDAAASCRALPTLLTHGKYDLKATLEDLDQTRKLLAAFSPDVQEQTFETSGHLPHLDEKDPYLAVLINFLNGVDGASWNVPTGI